MSAVSRVTRRAIVTTVDNPALHWYKDAKCRAAHYIHDVMEISGAKEAFGNAVTHATAEDGILLLGTQSFVGEALDFWDIDTCKLW